MKKRVAIALTAICMAVVCLTGCQAVTKDYGGEMTVNLEPNQKLEEVTWKGLIDYDRLEKIQMRAAEKMAKRPIFLGTKRIDEPLPKGAVPAL